MNKVYALTDQEFIDLINNSNSYAECVIKVGYASVNGRYGSDLIKKRCKELNISTDHFSGNYKCQFAKYDLSEILIKDSTYTNLTSLKNRIIKEGLLEYKCDKCGNTGNWNGKPLSLQLDHINGIHNDNRLENLRFLCPNCHSQTDTFSKRKRNNDIG